MKLAFIFSLVLLLFSAVPAMAQEPTPEFEMPYNFDPIDYESGETNPVAVNVGDQIVSVGFINRIGSLAATVWSMLDNFAGGGVLGYFLIVVFGVLVIRWLASFVFSKPMQQSLDLTGTADVVGEYDPNLGKRSRSFVRLIKNKPRF